MNNSITERAMLVSLNIQQWMGAKHDKQVSKEVATRHKSDENMGRFQKLLVGKEALEKLRELTSKARHEHYNRTLPWADGGCRILSAKGYFEYAERMRELQAEWDVAVTDFVRQYPQYVDDARKRLNGLFKQDDYPAAAKMHRKFSFKFDVLPMPTGDDFRVKLGDDETARVRAEIEQSVNESLEHAMNDVWERLRDVVARMVERLRAYNVTDKGVENPFRDSLVDNVRELLEMLPTLNITDDRKLNQFAKRIKSELCANNADVLRENDTTRDATAKAAEKILKEMENFI